MRVYEHEASRWRVGVTNVRERRHRQNTYILDYTTPRSVSQPKNNGKYSFPSRSTISPLHAWQQLAVYA